MLDKAQTKHGATSKEGMAWESSSEMPAMEGQMETRRMIKAKQARGLPGGYILVPASEEQYTSRENTPY